MKTISDDIIHEIVINWGSRSARSRSRKIKKLSKLYHVAISTIYRKIKKCRTNRQRDINVRADRGIPRLISENEMRVYVKAIMGYKAYDPKKPDMRISNPNKATSTARSIEIQENRGIIPKGLLNVRTVNRWAKTYELTVKHICAQRPAVKLVSLYPNHVHLVDFSVCEQYYLRDSDGKIERMTWDNKNRPNESKEKIWLFMLVDHCSNSKYAKYFISPGESTEIFIEGLIEAWSIKNDSQFPFHGAPKNLYADRGSAINSEKAQEFLKALGVNVITHKPGNPRAKGMVEGAIKHIQVDFENELRHCPASTIEELNARAYNWNVVHNMQIKSGEESTRNSIWQSITQEQLLELPPVELLRRVAATGAIRNVDRSCTIRFKNEIFGVPEGLVGKKVRVWTNIDGGLSVQDMETGAMHPVSEQRTAVIGSSYHAFKRSAAEVYQDEALAMAHELKKEITPDVLRREVPNIHAMPRKGTEVEVDSPIAGLMNQAPTYATVYHAKKAIAEELKINLGDLPEWMIDEIDTALMSNPSKSLRKDTVHNIAVFIDEFLRTEEAV
jgi:hypothetical protein